MLIADACSLDLAVYQWAADEHNSTHLDPANALMNRALLMAETEVHERLVILVQRAFPKL